MLHKVDSAEAAAAVVSAVLIGVERFVAVTVALGSMWIAEAEAERSAFVVEEYSSAASVVG